MKTRRIPLVACCTITGLIAAAQNVQVIDSSSPGFRTVIAGKEYQRSSFHNFFWGRHYRKEWATPVKVPVLDLDTAAGGLTPIEKGGGRQTKTLRLRNAAGKQYVLRSINKTYNGALPDLYSGTFVEDVANDQVSTAHPFAAITIPPMISQTGVYHTLPKIVFLPHSAALGEYNEKFGNNLYLFEERADDDQSEAANFGNASDVVGTPKMLEKIREENDHIVDQQAFVRARLFDMFIGDWGRHEDQWRWAKFDSAGYKLYRPVPRDRDQAYTKFDGVLVNFAISLADLDHLQSFSKTIDDIETYNFPARNLDRRLSNGMNPSDWVRIAKELQAVLTDAVIEEGVKQLPPEMFAISGQEIIKKLKRRRDDLPKYAEQYSNFISRRVDVVGSQKDELFLVNRINRDETRVEIYDLDKEGRPKEFPSYSRVFDEDNTKELRLYGLRGSDKYRVTGANNPLRIRIIGGTDKDSVVNASDGGSIRYYDNPGNDVSGRMRKQYASDTSINSYNYGAFKYNSGGITGMPTYNNRRGIYLKLGYKFEKQGWRKDPFAWKQKATGYYSITNKSFGADYEGAFIELIGKWNLLLTGSYDQLLDNNFLGIGNETKFDSVRDYLKMFTKEANFTTDFNRKIGRYHEFGIRGIFDLVEVKKDKSPILKEHASQFDPELFSEQKFLGGELYYQYQQLNDYVIPTRGFRAILTANHTQNLTNTSRSFNRYTAQAGFYLPFGSAISLASRNGYATVQGDPEVYQLNTIGGGQTLRGYFRQRFYGESSFFNNNDLRWIFNVRGHLFNGKMGIIAFQDNARVWNEGEKSTKWHMGYGGGLLIAPFNKISITAYYGVSEELGKFHFRIGRFF